MSGLPRRILHGFAALLALAISAFGNPRLGPERAPDPERVMVRISEAAVAPQEAVPPCAELTQALPACARSQSLRSGVDAKPGRQLAPCGAHGPRAPCAS